MTDDDPFAVLAQEQMTSPAKAKLRAAKTREERRQAQAQSDQQILTAQWREWHRKRVKRLKTGRYVNAVNIVASFLEQMTLQDGAKLVTLIDKGPWREADADTRYLLLGLIDWRIILLRETEGWPPFDDSIPFSQDEPTAFELVREILGHDSTQEF